MNGAEKDEKSGMTRGDFVELESSGGARPLPTVRIDGPYGAPAEDVFDVEVAVLIGAGIGNCIRNTGSLVSSLIGNACAQVLHHSHLS